MNNKVNTDYSMVQTCEASECSEQKGLKNLSKIKSIIHLNWYKFRVKYNRLLLECCLDRNLRGKILQKVEKLSQKLNKLKINPLDEL
ncbi:hypothetical protein V7128_17720 [Neobacillus vireti]|uniref:hypothetical protein n=1 Tax=Neobacillus vireti TaxID=220686 RepID=UPI002FFF6ABA